MKGIVLHLLFQGSTKRVAKYTMRVTLHTQTLLTTSLQDILSIAKAVGFSGIDIGSAHYDPMEESPEAAASAIDLILSSGMSVSSLCVRLPWAEDTEGVQMLKRIEIACALAVRLGCSVVYSPIDDVDCDDVATVQIVRRLADLAQRHGLRLALEFNSQGKRVNTLEQVESLIEKVAHESCGLVLDTYHIGRNGTAIEKLARLRPEDIVHVQFSDLPKQGLRPGYIRDRVPPGQGSFAFHEFWKLLKKKDYRGFIAYEAPNESNFKRNPMEVAQEAMTGIRDSLDGAQN